MKCQSEFEVSLKLIESLYLKIDPCLDKEILVTLIAVYHKGMWDINSETRQIGTFPSLS